MEPAPLGRTTLVAQLGALGVEPGDTLMIHASLRRVGPVEGRADGLIDALLAAVGPDGTLFAYADFEVTAEVPYFDLDRSPCAADHGVFPEVLRRRAGTLRSANPGASVLALGARAAELTSPHPLDHGYGPDTPFERFVVGGGKILLLGSSLDAVSILHHVEAIAALPDKRLIHYDVPIFTDRAIRHVTIEELDTSNPVVAAMPEDYFERVIRGFLAEHALAPRRVGGALSHLLDARALVRHAQERMEREYGHPHGPPAPEAPSTDRPATREEAPGSPRRR